MSQPNSSRGRRPSLAAIWSGARRGSLLASSAPAAGSAARLASLAIAAAPIALWSFAAFPASLRAQRIELQILGGQVTDESGSVGRGLTIVPAISFSGPGRWLRLEGRGTALDGGNRVIGGGGSFYLGAARTGWTQPSVSGSASLLTADGGFRSMSGEITPGVRVGTAAASVGAGVGLRGVSLSSSPAAWRDALPFDESSSRTFIARSAWAEGRASTGPLSVSVLGRASRATERTWRDAQAAASVQSGALTISGFAGARSGDVQGSWGGGGVSVRVAPGLELMGQVARLATDPLTGQPGGRTATIGVSVSHGGPSSILRTSPRSVRLAVSAAPGARVELLGDWNEWRAEPVAHSGDGVFAREVRLPPGVYHFVFRVNGEVRLPEGYETAPDDFGGKSAVVRVRG
jgi:hypothetical protein